MKKLNSGTMLKERISQENLGVNSKRVNNTEFLINVICGYKYMIYYCFYFLHIRHKDLFKFTCLKNVSEEFSSKSG